MLRQRVDVCYSKEWMCVGDQLPRSRAASHIFSQNLSARQEGTLPREISTLEPPFPTTTAHLGLPLLALPQPVQTLCIPFVHRKNEVERRCRILVGRYLLPAINHLRASGRHFLVHCPCFCHEDSGTAMWMAQIAHATALPPCCHADRSLESEAPPMRSGVQMSRQAQAHPLSSHVRAEESAALEPPLSAARFALRQAGGSNGQRRLRG